MKIEPIPETASAHDAVGALSDAAEKLIQHIYEAVDGLPQWQRKAILYSISDRLEHEANLSNPKKEVQ